MRLLSTPMLLREGSVPDYLLKQRVTKLGLDFSLVTRWTTFVAVANKIYNNNPAQTSTRPVSLVQAKGVSHFGLWQHDCAVAESAIPVYWLCHARTGHDFRPSVDRIVFRLGCGALTSCSHKLPVEPSSWGLPSALMPPARAAIFLPSQPSTLCNKPC